MTTDNVLECGSFDDKIKDISQYLKTNVLEPAEKEKSDILAQAEEEKKKIIQAAQDEAAQIIADAKKKAEAEKHNLESSLRIAAKKSIDTLKSALEKEILKQSVEQPSGEVLANESLLKEFISEVIKLVFNNNAEADLAILLSDSLKAKVSDYIKSEIIAKSKNKIALSDERVPSGFSVVLKESGLMYDFSNESIVELISSFLTPELRKYLFEK